MHISLDSALGRQRRLNSVGDSVLQIAPNAAAAYSLRSLTGGDPKVVRVRRASDNGERDFTGSEITSGEMVNWVNKQVIAPLDIQALEADGRTGDFLIAKAAYSLRSLGTRQATLAATGDTVARADGKFVVQVRRSSDDTLKSFTADEVTDGTLLAFVTDAQIGWNVQPTFSNAAGTGSVTSQSSTATTATVSFTGEAGLIRENSKPNHVLGSSGDQVIFNISVSGLDSAGTLRLRTSGTNTTVGSSTVSNGDNQDITLNLIGSAGYLAMTFVASSGGTITFNSIKVLPKTGFVKTWYDQSVTTEQGNVATGHHAVQATPANQPLIVSAGALVADNGIGGIDFDGATSSRSLVAPSVSGLTGSLSMFSASVRDSSGHIVSLSSSSSNSKYFAIQEAGSTSVANPRNTASITASDSVSGSTRLTFALTTGATSTSAGALGSAVTTSTSDYGGFSGSNLDQIAIGTLRTVSPTGFFNGRIREILVYTSDQTDNRGAIEANIGEAYSITGIPAYDDEVDGFVETWYDQSGNSNNVTQATASLQPKIVNAGTLVTATNSLPAIDFTSSITRLIRAEFLTGQLNSYFNTYQAEAGDSTQAQVVVRQGLNYRLVNQVETDGKVRSQIRDSGGSSEIVQAGGDLATGSPLLHTTLIEARGSDGITIFVNGANEVIGDTADIEDTNFATADTGDFAIGAIYNSNSFDFHGKGQEFIFYNSDQSANRVAVETNINSHYSIF